MFHSGWGTPWLIVTILIIIPFWRLCQRVGYSPWLSLLLLVPLANLFFIYYLAFGEWPVARGAGSASST